MAKEKIRIRLKAYDHMLIDQSCEKIVETAKWLSPYEVSDVIDVSGGSYILVGMERDTAVLSTTTGVGQIGQLYLEYCMYNKIAEQKNTMSVTYKPAFDQYVNTVLE